MTRPLKYREQVISTATEILVSKLKRDTGPRQNDLPRQLVNTNESGDDLYAKPEVPDTKGYPGWITGNGSMSKGAYATRPMTLAPESDMLRSGLPYRLGSWMADQGAYGKPRLRPVGNYLTHIGTRPGLAALEGGLGGAAVGAGAGALTGHGAVLGGGLGALLGSIGSYGAGFLTKASSDSVGYLIQRLDTDFGISGSTRELLSDAVQRLAPQQANVLADLVRMSFGAGLASVIAHYLFKLGLVGTSIFALIGAGAAYGLGRQNRNAFGERVQSGTDPFGRPL